MIPVNIKSCLTSWRFPIIRRNYFGEKVNAIGWIGLRSDIYRALSEREGKHFIGDGIQVKGKIMYGLDPEEIVLADDVQYQLNEKWKNLTRLMEDSPYGSKVNVIA